MKKPESFFENIFLALLFAIGIAIFYGNTGLRTAMVEPLSPGGYGQGVSGLLCILCLARFLWNNFRGTAFAPRSESARTADVVEHSFMIKEKPLIACQALLMIFYAYGITTVGYFTSTYIYSIISILLLTDQRTWKAIAVYAVGLVGFCYLLYLCFDVFQVMMPNTPLI